jgi:hypothetical protein
MRAYLILIMICLLATGCRKREYPPEKVQIDAEPIYCNGSIDNEPLVLKVGADGYYCYSSFNQRQDSIYLFEGELKKFGCHACGSSFRVLLSDYRRRSAGAPVFVDSSFRTGGRQFLPEVSRANKFTFTALSNKQIISQRWDFSDGTSSTSLQTDHEFRQLGVQSVSLTVVNTGNCENTVVNKIYISDADYFACAVSSSATANSVGVFTGQVSGGKPPFRYTWNFGDGSVSNLQNPTHTYTSGEEATR